MPAPEIHEELCDGTVTLRVTGTFNGQAALAVREVLGRHLGEPVVLDFSQVRDFLDLAVPVLAGALQREGVTLRGLGRHSERVFRYFGVFEPQPRDRRDFWKPEEALLY